MANDTLCDLAFVASRPIHDDVVTVVVVELRGQPTGLRDPEVRARVNRGVGILRL